MRKLVEMMMGWKTWRKVDEMMMGWKTWRRKVYKTMMMIVVIDLPLWQELHCHLVLRRKSFLSASTSALAESMVVMRVGSSLRKVTGGLEMPSLASCRRTWENSLEKTRRTETAATCPETGSSCCLETPGSSR
jgi:hypothetical protein